VIEAAAALAAEKFGIDAPEVFGSGQSASVVAARNWAYMRLNDGAVPLQNGVVWSAVEIGLAVKRHPSTVSEAIRGLRKCLAAADADVCQSAGEERALQ
jgi:hypothetical protein